MPFKSIAQSRMFHGIANGSIPAGHGLPSKAVADKFVKDSHGQRVRDLPDHVPHHADGGRAEAVYPPPFRW